MDNSGDRVVEAGQEKWSMTEITSFTCANGEFKKYLASETAGNEHAPK